MTLTRHHIFGSLDVWKQMEQNNRSQYVALLPWCRMNSRWILLIPGALFGFRCLIANTISSFVKFPDGLRSVLSALCRSFTLPVVLVKKKKRSVFSNLPLLMSWAAMASAVIGKRVGLVTRQVSLLIV